MLPRIQAITEQVISKQRYFQTTPVEYDRSDLFLPPVTMSAKRVCEYILAQEPQLDERCALTGYLRFDGSVEGDVFGRSGHKNFAQAMQHFYNKPMENLTTFEWQHSVADYKKVLEIGIDGLIAEIRLSRKNHTDPDRLRFLDALEQVASTIVAWAHKCADRADALGKQSNDPEVKTRMTKLATALHRVPQYPAESFYEAVLCIYLCYAFVPDSIGTIDRYLFPYYQKDVTSGDLTREDACAYLQELFLMLQGRIWPESDRFYRGGESHFCIGGYLPNGKDGFNELSRLIVEAMLELPTWIPQISLRWTPDTPREVLHFMMDCERRDPNKRIAFVNDVPRLKGFTEISELPYEVACNYTMVGCNEPALPGGIFFGVDTSNIARSMANTMHLRTSDVIAAPDFDAFYAVFEQELQKDVRCMIEIAAGFQEMRARDCNVVSSLFFSGCIENARSVTQGGCDRYIANAGLVGLTNVIDSLAVVKQFVYEEKRVTMAELADALQKNWEGYEDLHTEILRRTRFFGNNDPFADDLARRFYDSLYRFFQDKNNYLHKSFIIGNLVGYNEHHTFFGNGTLATPDGRYAGQPLQFGAGQSEGRDREGLSALLTSIATCDPHAVMVGPSVTNVLLDEKLVNDDAQFEKLVLLFETYFRMGGTHFQLSYVSQEKLRCAQAEPDKYRTLRVRVSGFSDYFIFLNRGLQDEILLRTKKEG